MGNHVNPGTVPNLEDFIPPGEHDIYALGFQEMPGKGREQWVHEIKAHVMNINEGFKEADTNSYFLLKDVRLWDIYLGGQDAHKRAHFFIAFIIFPPSFAPPLSSLLPCSPIVLYFYLSDWSFSHIGAAKTTIPNRQRRGEHG